MKHFALEFLAGLSNGLTGVMVIGLAAVILVQPGRAETVTRRVVPVSLCPTSATVTLYMPCRETVYGRGWREA